MHTVRSRVLFVLGIVAITLNAIGACSTFHENSDAISPDGGADVDGHEDASPLGDATTSTDTSASDVTDAAIAPRFCETYDAGDASLRLCDDFDNVVKQDASYTPPWNDVLVQQDAGVTRAVGFSSPPFAFEAFGVTTGDVSSPTLAQLGYSGPMPTTDIVEVSFDVRIDALVQTPPDGVPLAQICFLRISYGTTATDRVWLFFTRQNNNSAVGGFAFIEGDSNNVFDPTVVFTLGQPRHITFTLNQTLKSFSVTQGEVNLITHNLSRPFGTAYRVELGALIGDPFTAGQLSFDNAIIITH